MSFRCKQKKPPRNAGFSLLEVSITVALIIILTSLIAFNYGSFNGKTLLRNQAFEIALGVRQVQLTSLNSQGTGGGFREEFGVYFAPGNASYVFFRDSGTATPPQYDAGEEIDGAVQLDPRFVIDDVCMEHVQGGTTKFVCGSDGVTDVHVSYRRPNFDALFFPETWGGSTRTVITAIVRIKPASVSTSCEVDETQCYDVYMTNTGLIYSQKSTAL